MFDESESPKYLRPEVTAELKRRSVQCYPSLAPLFCPENPHAAFAYVDSSRLEHGVCGIEMPLETPLDEFTANVAVLHEIGHIVSEKKKIPRSVWRKEIAAWKCAEKIRDSIGFPQGDPRTGNTWDEAKRFALSPYEPLRIRFVTDVLPFIRNSIVGAAVTFLLHSLVFNLVFLAYGHPATILPDLMRASWRSFAIAATGVGLSMAVVSRAAWRIYEKWTGRKLESQNSQSESEN